MCSDVTGECIPSMCVKLLITCMSEEMGETVWRVDDVFNGSRRHLFKTKNTWKRG